MKELEIRELSEEEYRNLFNFQKGDIVTVKNDGVIGGNECSLKIGDTGQVIEVHERHLTVLFSSGLKQGNTHKYLKERFIKKYEGTPYRRA